MRFKENHLLIPFYCLCAIFPFVTNGKIIEYLAVSVFITQIILVYKSIGKILPVRHLFGLMMSLQILIGPVLVYNGFDEFITNDNYRMDTSSEVYFSYALPAVALFIIGLNIFSYKHSGENINIVAIKNAIKGQKNMPYILIAMGFLGNIIENIVPTELQFVTYLMGAFKFIGLFTLIIGEKKLKMWVLVLVFGSIIYTTLQSAMFHDLITWLIFLVSILFLRY